MRGGGDGPEEFRIAGLVPFPDRRLAGKKLFEAESLRERDRYCGLGWHERSSDAKRDYRNGFYERDYVTCFGTIRLRIARSRGKNFLPAGLRRLQRRAEEVALLIRDKALLYEIVQEE